MKPTRILIADDHPIIHLGLAAVLAAQRADWEICAAAANGAEAVRGALCYRPEIVIMDYKMPLLNGLEAAQQIKKRLPRIEALIFTGASSPRILLEIFHSKVCGSLLKCEAVDTLLPALIALRGHHRFRSSGLTARCERMMARGAHFQKLTPREREIVRLIVEGQQVKEIASSLGVSIKTIDSHRTSIFAKLRVRSSAELVRSAFRYGLAGWEEDSKVTNE